FEHVKAPAQLLQTLAAHLKDNGVIRIAVPNGMNLFKAQEKGSWKPSKDCVHPLEHISSFTHENLVLLGKKSGLTPVPTFEFIGWQIKNLISGSSSITQAYRCLTRHVYGTAIWFRKNAA